MVTFPVEIFHLFQNSLSCSLSSRLFFPPQSPVGKEWIYRFKYIFYFSVHASLDHTFFSDSDYTWLPYWCLPLPSLLLLTEHLKIQSSSILVFVFFFVFFSVSGSHMSEKWCVPPLSDVFGLKNPDSDPTDPSQLFLFSDHSGQYHLKVVFHNYFFRSWKEKELTCKSTATSHPHTAPPGSHDILCCDTASWKGTPRYPLNHTDHMWKYLFRKFSHHVWPTGNEKGAA